MEQIILPPRLDKIASFVPDGSRLADIGTDHGWLPISLLEQGRIKYAVATDIRPGPLERAMAHFLERCVENMECILCDGLKGVEPYSVDCVVVAGMGGDTISAILSASPWACKSCLMILQPMSKPEILRRNLSVLGLTTLSEHLVEDNHRIYPILICRNGTPTVYSDAEFLIGKFDMLQADPLFQPKLERTMEQLSDALNGISLSTRDGDRVRADCLRAVLTEMKEMRGALK